MIEYRLTWSKKPTLRLWKVEGKNRRLLAEVTRRKAKLAEETVIRSASLKTIMKFRDGRVIYQTEEETAIRIMIALRSIIGIRKEIHAVKLLETVEKMDRGEVYWWYSLCLKLGHKAISALRSAYL